MIGAFAGATAGFTAGGFVRPERWAEDRRPLQAETGATVAIPVGTPEEAERARRSLEGSGPLRVEETDSEGFPTGASQRGGPDRCAGGSAPNRPAPAR